MKKMPSKKATKHGECQQKKRKSRDAARSRRGQQNDGYSKLASELPLPLSVSSQLDRLCVMRLANSYIRMKQLMNSMTKQDVSTIASFNESDRQPFDEALLESLDGFVFVVTADGQCLYVSDNVSHYMGLSQTDVCGNSFYNYVHPCDHEELANQLGGRIPLEYMEIFDGLFCSDSVFMMSNLLKGGSKRKQDIDNPYKSFSLRMKSTLTSRGKSVNLKASTYRVVHCTGCMKMKTTVNEDGTEETTPHFMVAIGVPLMVASNFEVPLDRCTFTSRHSLDMKILSCDDKVHHLLGYLPMEIIGKSWYNFQHACDLDTALACHKTLLTKGQSVSKYYRFLVQDGGWVWLQTKANIVYDSKTCQPQFILCINYLLGGIEWKGHVLATEQINPVPLPTALVTLAGAEEAKKWQRGKRKKPPHSIVLQERTKVLKATKKQATKRVQAKGEPKESGDSYMQDFLDKCENAGDESEPMKPKAEKDAETETKKIEENFDERAPFIPLPDVDDALEIDDEMLMEIPFLDSPFSWLMEDDIPIDQGSPEPFNSDATLPATFNYKPFSQTVESRPARKNILLVGTTAFAANPPVSAGKFMPLVTQFDAEVNAPLGASHLLQGEELFRALESGNY